MVLPAPDQGGSKINQYLQRLQQTAKDSAVDRHSSGKQLNWIQANGSVLQDALFCFCIHLSRRLLVLDVLCVNQVTARAAGDRCTVHNCSVGHDKMTGVVSTVEMHTAGEPFRIITSGLPQIPGNTIIERRIWLKQNADTFRTALMLEPRGHADMYGGYLTEPVSGQADLGIIFIHNEGYSDHCGHGVIALATAAVELGWVSLSQPETRVGIDAPCGFIEASVQWDGCHAGDVRFINVASFMLHRDVTVITPSFGEVMGDVAYGGAFYFYTDGAKHGLAARENNVEDLKRFGSEVKAAANAALSVQHPVVPDINHIYGTVVHNVPRHKTSTQANCCVFANRQVDRSPTGSGTAGRAAQLYSRGLLDKDAVLVNESIIGSTFSAKVLHETKVEHLDAVVPEVSGRAYITGFASWIIDVRDVLAQGFLVR